MNFKSFQPLSHFKIDPTMPLIVLCGLPSSGKTTFTNSLIAQLKTLLPPNYAIEHITDSTLGFTRAHYSTQFEEKKLRGSLLASVERALTKDKIVILDSNNYIKGFRYQLFCIVKSVGTTQCLVSVLFKFYCFSVDLIDNVFI